MSTPWWAAAFGADYPSVYPHRDVASARREVAFLLERGVRGRVLDLACGFGRHSLAFLERGVDVVGVDYSFELLLAARTLPGAEPVRGRLIRADARSLPFANASFRAAALLFSSFGYFGEDGDKAVIAQLARVVQRDGIAVLDLMNPARTRAALVPRSRTRRGAAWVVERRALVDGGRRVTKDVDVELPDGSSRSWREDVRMYEPDEIDAVLAANGFDVFERHGDFTGSKFDATAPRQILLARRR